MQNHITRITKKTSESKMRRDCSILPRDMNSKWALYGGALLDIADNISGSVAIKHTRTRVTTASIDSMDFLEPFELGQFILGEAFVSGVGNKSLEICVKFIGEEPFTGRQFLGAMAFFTYVAIGLKEGEKVPFIEGETEEEKLIMKGYEKRRKLVKERIKTMRSLNVL